jgi:hypothetical protein
MLARQLHPLRIANPGLARGIRQTGTAVARPVAAAPLAPGPVTAATRSGTAGEPASRPGSRTMSMWRCTNEYGPEPGERLDSASAGDDP